MDVPGFSVTGKDDQFDYDGLFQASVEKSSRRNSPQDGERYAPDRRNNSHM